MYDRIVPAALVGFALIGFGACSSTTGADASVDATSHLDVMDEPSDASDVTALPDAPGLWPAGGELSVTLADFGAGTTVSAGAAFWNASSGGAGVDCTYRVDGPCTIRTCAPRGTTNAPTAGAISMSVDGIDRLTLTPDALGLYATAGHGVPTWMPGAMITFTASGADVSAFTATLVAPPALTVTTPAVGTSIVPISRANGFTAQWSPIATGLVRISIRQQREMGTTALQGGETVECFFPSSAGTGTVPSTSLADFTPASGGVSNAEVLVFSVAAANVSAGSASVAVMANAGGLYAQGAVQ